MFQDSPMIYIIAIFCTISFSSTFLQAQLSANTVTRPVYRYPNSNTNVTYAWSSWGTWSACSRSCGGGVAVQDRQCLPKDPIRWRRSRKRRKLTTSTERLHRSVRDLKPYSNQACPGVARRYHECNTTPCPGPPMDSRAEQCAAYDRRPFRGRFYTWVPYVDGEAPCTLNCRPRGQHFYATLALAADGTPCTKPGFRAICVQGSCQVVGREAVLSSATSRELRCGRRLVSGLFNRPRLPIGYSYITTVPRGACRLNVSEIVPSQNYIALKLVNGSYIMNGEFAVSKPGPYDAAGARFIYTRSLDQDVIYSHGPLQDPIDIMVLYTQPNPSIKYEYLTDSEENSEDNKVNSAFAQHHPMHHHHRHHVGESHTKSLEHSRSDPSLSNSLEMSNALEPVPQIEANTISGRKFVWKILTFTECTRSCGGGLQIGKFRCVEVNGRDEKEVSPAHCTGASPLPRRRRCGLGPCPPRWRAAPWGPCPMCGPAKRSRIVGCVQDHAKGITKISDQKCPLPMPPSTEACDIPNCDGSSVNSETPRPDTRRQVRTRDHTDTFKDNPVYQSANSSENEVSAHVEGSTSYSFSASGGWLYTEWSDCVGWCVGGGVQSRGVRCSDPAGCSPQRAPEALQHCTPRQPCEHDDGMWFTSEWSLCSAACDGRQVRAVICISSRGRRLRDGSCRQTRPSNERVCGGTCAPSWYLSDWGECQGPCESGVQSRTVWCAKGGAEGATGAAKDTECSGSRPAAKRTCVPARCSTPVRPQPIKPPADNTQRVTRHQNKRVQTGECVDKLTNCALAVQARLCHYHYYAEYCCRSCRGR